jgi:hypothetical protein
MSLSNKTKGQNFFSDLRWEPGHHMTQTSPCSAHRMLNANIGIDFGVPVHINMHWNLHIIMNEYGLHFSI